MDSEKSQKRTEIINNTSVEFAYGGDKNIIETVQEEIRQEIKLEDFKPDSHFRYHFEDNQTFVKILGASGNETSNVSNLKVMTDPLKANVRKDMIDCAYTDPILSPSFERRKDAQFEDGFTLEFESAVTRHPETDQLLSPEETELLIEEHKPQYLGFLNQIRKWADDMNLEEIMDEFTVHELNQGRCVTFYYPGIFELQEISSSMFSDTKPLPNTLEIVPVEDLREPIVDISSGKKLVGVNTDWKVEDEEEGEDKKRVIRKDEMVYGVRRNYMLRKDSGFFGSSLLEPIIVMSKALKKLYNFDIPDAVVASYITKLIFQFKNPQVRSEDITNVITNYLKTGKKAYGTNQAITITPVANKVDISAIQALEKILTDTIGAVLGVPKSQLNREHNLNRDIATVEAIQFIKYIRKPDEKHIAKLFEDQLLNPLFAYLCEKNLNDLPVRIRIKARKDPDEIIDSLMEQKEKEIQQANIEQPGSTSVFGAAGKETSKKKLNGNLEKQLDLLLKK